MTSLPETTRKLHIGWLSDYTPTYSINNMCQVKFFFSFLLLICSFSLFAQNEASDEMEPKPLQLSAAPDLEEIDTIPPIYQLNGTFRIMRDRVLDGVGDESQSGSFYSLRIHQIDQIFVGQYVEIANDSEFIGQIYQSTREPGLKMLQFEQYDQGYLGYYVGFWKGGKIQGAWYNSGGKSGDFVLLQN